MPVLDVFMAVILCILLAEFYTLRHPDVFLPVVKMPWDIANFQPAEIQWMYICQKCLVRCIFDSKMEVLNVFMALILCMIVLLAEVYTL